MSGDSAGPFTAFQGTGLKLSLEVSEEALRTITAELSARDQRDLEMTRKWRDTGFQLLATAIDLARGYVATQQGADEEDGTPGPTVAPPPVKEHVVYEQSDRMAVILNVFGLTPAQAMDLLDMFQVYADRSVMCDETPPAPDGYSKETYNALMGRVEGALRVLGLRLSEARKVLLDMAGTEPATPKGDEP